MHIKESNRFGPVTESDLAAFERERRIKLPPDYRGFLLNHNGGDPRPSATIDFRQDGEDNATTIQYFYGLHDGEYWASLQYAIEAYHGRLVRKAVPIANDSCGNLLVILVGGFKRGRVYFWDHEQERERPTFANMSFLARTFTELASKLYEYVPPDESESDRIIRENDLVGLKVLLDSGYDVDTLDEYERSMIENAAIENRPQIIQVLHDHGASLRDALEIAKQNRKHFPEHQASVDVLEELQAKKEG